MWRDESEELPREGQIELEQILQKNDPLPMEEVWVIPLTGIPPKGKTKKRKRVKK